MLLRKILFACSIATLSTVTTASPSTTQPADTGSGADVSTNTNETAVSVRVQGKKPVPPKTIYTPHVNPKASTPESPPSTSTKQ